MSLGILMIAFYITCAVFIVGILGTLLYAVARINIFSLMKYLAREYLLIVGTSSSESALPRLIAKMEHLGVSKPVVGITVPTGYSFNLDGTAIYLTMASLFIAAGMGMPMSIPEQIGLLLFMIIASKGAAGVTGAGLATLAGGLQAYRPDLVDGVGVIVGIDRFMSEGRAITNFTGNAVATVLIGTWVKEIDSKPGTPCCAGEIPFDETTLSGDGHDGMSDAKDAVGTQGLEEAAVDEAEAKQERAASARPLCGLTAPLQRLSPPADSRRARARVVGLLRRRRRAGRRPRRSAGPSASASSSRGRVGVIRPDRAGRRLPCDRSRGTWDRRP